MLIEDSLQLRKKKVSPQIRRVIEKVSSSYLRHVVESTAIPRHYIAENRNNKKIARWIKEQFESFGCKVSLQGECDNLVALPQSPPFPPASRLILIGAHYDSVPGSPGADDNASSVAVTLACAKLLSLYAPDAPAIFVAFNREEENLFGSRLFVRHLLGQDELEIGEAHILEMVGYCSYEQDSQRLPGGLPPSVPASGIGDFLGIIGNHTSNRFVEEILQLAVTYLGGFHVLGLKTYPGPDERVHHLRRSDHVPFWDAGIPALMWTDTAEFRNANYHRHSDTPGTLDYSFMKKVTQLLLARVLSHKP